MLQLKNNTPFAATMALFPDLQGVDTLYIIVKASFNIGSKWTLLDKQVPPVAEDVHWGEPGLSSIRYASDFHIGKQATDVIVNGQAYADAANTRQMDVSAEVGAISKTIRVFGERVWQQGKISAPQPFERMPLTYENAFGGTVVIDGEAREHEARNPLGRGFVGKAKRAVDGMPLPNLEDPRQLIGNPEDQPMPACFGTVAPHWEPRASRAGTYDQQWQQSRSPYLPLDFNPQFFNAAHPELVYPGYLVGGEPVTLRGLHAQGDLVFSIPQVKLVSQVFVRNRVENPPFNMETLLIEPDHLRLFMVWKAAMRCDKESLKIRAINVNLSR